MANIKSAKKRILVNQAKTEENKRLKTNLKTVLKKAEAAIETNAADKDAAVKLAVKKGFSGLKGFVNGVLRNVARSLDQVKKEIQTGFACKQSQRLIFHFAQTAAGYVSIRLFVLKRFSLIGTIRSESFAACTYCPVQAAKYFKGGIATGKTVKQARCLQGVPVRTYRRG